jgi:6-phosphogluconolactonase
MATAEGSIFADAMDTDGNLQPANHGQPVANVSSPAILATDQSGKLLLVVSAAPALTVFRINMANGTLQPSPQGAIALDAGTPRQLYITPNDGYVFVALGSGGVYGFALYPQEGTLQNRIHIAPVNGGESQDNDVASNSDATLLFIGEKGAGIRVLKIGASGATTEVSGSPFASQFGTASSLVASAGNSKLYAAYPAANKLATYSIAGSGALTLASAMPFSPAPSSTALSLDAAGTHVLALTNRATVQSFPTGNGPDK